MTKIRMNFCAPVLIFAALFAALPVRAQSSSATIDSLASDLAALTARVAKLEGQITVADLAGTYALNAIQMELGGGSTPESRPTSLPGPPCCRQTAQESS